jgi:hypothetical protein
MGWKGLFIIMGQDGGLYLFIKAGQNVGLHYNGIGPHLL